jgi:hypothetical protein
MAGWRWGLTVMESLDFSAFEGSLRFIRSNNYLLDAA